ncbi:MAG: hypothetical protein LBL46_03730 [Rickettsiales bacterium]|jgi:hypothetical protein|nr:hypothetical protein [Rickettsiales bacterium]
MKTKRVFISGGENYPPEEIKAELDKIRAELMLGDDVVLFGIPAETNREPQTANREAKIIPFPIRKKPILNIIARPEDSTPEPAAAPTRIEIEQTERLVVDFDDAEDDEPTSITDILGKLPSISEDPLPAQSMPAAQAAAGTTAGIALTDEFVDFLDKDPLPKKTKVLPFKRKKNAFTNVLGDLFTFAGGAANDDSRDYVLPDFIKRP